jgi:hypothetical protein
MNDAVTMPSSKRPDRLNALTFGKAMSMLWKCAWEALILTFLVQIFGTLAVGLVSGLWSEMTPSLPPGLAAKSNPEGQWDFRFFPQHQFALVFAMLFIAKAAGRFVRYSRNEEHRNTVAWMKRVSRGISEQWFSLVVINAFVAFGAVVMVQLAQKFSLTHWLWHFLTGLFDPVISAIASIFPSRVVGAVKSLVGWYDANHFKFTFWLFYSAAICDDLGLPNYKTLGRFLWRRFRMRRKSVVAATTPRTAD